MGSIPARHRLLITLIAVGFILCGCGGPSIVAKTRGKFLERQADLQYGIEDRLSSDAKTLYEQAVDQYNSALEFSPQDGAVFASRGWCKKQLGDKAGALRDLSEAVALAPGSAQCWMHRASLFEDMQVFDKALDDYDEAIKIAPSNPSPWVGKAKVRMLLGKTDLAIADYTQAIKLAPAPLTYCFRATGYRAAGDLKAMREDFAHAIKLDPHDWDIYRFRAYSEFIIGDYTNAIMDFKLLLRQTKFTDPHAPYAVIQGILASRLSNDRASEDYFFSNGLEQLGIPVASKAGAHDAELAANWPCPVIQFLHGDISEEAMFKAASGNNDSLTEARCYIGFDRLTKDHVDDAKKQFQWIKENGNKAFVEYEAAMVQLKSSKKEKSAG